MTEYRIVADADSVSAVFFIEERTSWKFLMFHGPGIWHRSKVFDFRGVYTPRYTRFEDARRFIIQARERESKQVLIPRRILEGPELGELGETYNDRPSE